MKGGVMKLHYVTIEIRLLIEYLSSDSFYVYFIDALEEGIEGEYVYGVLKKRYPEVANLLYHEPLKNLPLLMGGPYSKIVSWRLKRGV
jgi:hypothetical protein